MKGFNGTMKGRRALPVIGAPHVFGLPRLPKGEGLPPFMHKLQFGLDASFCDQFTQSPGQLFARPRCLATGRLPDITGPTLLDPSNGHNGRPMLNFSSSTTMRYPRIRIKNSRTTQFVLTKPTSPGSGYYLGEMGADVNTYPGLYFYQGGTSAVAWRSDLASHVTQAFTTSALGQRLLRGYTGDKGGNFGCCVMHCDPVKEEMWLRRDLVDVPITINWTGAPDYGWPNSPTGGIVEDFWIGSRSNTDLFYSGKLAVHYVYCDLTMKEALEVEAWLNERWAFATTPKLLFHMVADDAVGSHGSPITSLTDRVAGIAAATTGTFPKLKTNALNGRATLNYDADYSLKFPSLTLPGSHTFVLVSKRTSSTAEFVEHGTDANSVDGSWIYAGGNGMMSIRRTYQTNTVDTSFAGSSDVWYTRLTAGWGGLTGLMGMRNNDFISVGSVSSTGTPGMASHTADLWVGSRTASVLLLRGEIAELRIYEGALNLHQATRVMEELRATYGHY